MASLIAIFDFEIKYVKGDFNSLPNFFTHEFLQGVKWTKESLKYPKMS